MPHHDTNHDSSSSSTTSSTSSTSSDDHNSVMARRCCVIGAGPAGLTSTKSMRELGFHVTTFEQSDAIGGNWRYRSLDDPFAAVSASYQSLRTNTTRDGTAFSDFPMPDSYPLFPAHHEILAYLIDYAAHYRITDHVRFRHKVVSVEPELHADDGSVISEGDDALAGASSWIEPHLKWRVTYDDYSSLVHGSAPSVQQDPSARAVEPTRNTAVFDAIIIANGHHWLPNTRPELAGFTGRIVHSHSYRTPDIGDELDVVICGWGASAYDIARDLRARARVKSLSISSRTTVPFSCHGTEIVFKLLPAVSHAAGELLYFAAAPAAAADGGTATSSTALEPVHADLVISCSGYQLSFPFLRDSMIPVHRIDARIPTSQYVRMWEYFVPPELPNLIVVAVSNVGGSLHPVAEQQARWFGRVLTGQILPPSQAEMRASIDEWVEAVQAKHKVYRVMDIEPVSYCHRLATWGHTEPIKPAHRKRCIVS